MGFRTSRTSPVRLKTACRRIKGIRQQVCRILEGGSDAFRKRERRYALPEGGV